MSFTGIVYAKVSVHARHAVIVFRDSLSTRPLP